jgi:hypothetical protein
LCDNLKVIYKILLIVLKDFGIIKTRNNNILSVCGLIIKDSDINIIDPNLQQLFDELNEKRKLK